jgi:hypothetical protein
VNAPKGEQAIQWRLLSSKQLKGIKQVKQEIKRYEKRWLIEEYFKLLKTDGYDIENTQLEKGQSIRKLILLLMKTSIKVLQLKAARDGKNGAKTREVFNKDEITCLKHLNKELEGQTQKQKNPYDPSNLAWATWIIARLAGWKEYYTKSRPPGNKTLTEGLRKLDSIVLAFNIFKNKDVS